LSWYGSVGRDLPWRRTRDPYAIWISEVMLQQTRVAAAIGYYERFIERFPNVQTLADAPETDLLKQWAGLGYYYRARNLQKAARQIAAAGVFPSTFEGLLQLSGVGNYTAAAIASFAFELPHAVLDGNVYRVLSRVLADDTNIASTRARAHFSTVAEHLLDRTDPATYNQAIMELGATVCLPKRPQCLLCPASAVCRARAANTQEQFPVKSKTGKNAPESRTLFWIEQTGRVLAWQRPPHSRLMPGFWELPEVDQLPGAVPGDVLGAFRHGITVHDYRFQVFSASVPADLGTCQWLDLAAADAGPISTVFRKALKVVRMTRNPGYSVHVAAK
jgi:A/G-specific adenine glycosylase